MQSHAYWVQITALYHRIYWDIGVISRTAYRAGYLIGAHAIDKISTLKGLSRANPPCPLGRSLFCGIFLRGILTKITSIECREAESVFHSHFPMGSNLGRFGSPRDFGHGTVHQPTGLWLSGLHQIVTI